MYIYTHACLYTYIYIYVVPLGLPQGSILLSIVLGLLLGPCFGPSVGLQLIWVLPQGKAQQGPNRKTQQGPTGTAHQGPGGRLNKDHPTSLLAVLAEYISILNIHDKAVWRCPCGPHRVPTLFSERPGDPRGVAGASSRYP